MSDAIIALGIIALLVLASRTGGQTGGDLQLSAQPAVFPDACLGCARPGELCAQAQTQGLLVRVTCGGTVRAFRLGPDGSVRPDCGR